MTSPDVDIEFYEVRSDEKLATSDNPEMTQLVDRIEEWCDVSDGDTVLDFGCYDGYLLDRLAKRRKIVGVGIDISSTALRRAATLTSAPDLNFVVAGDGGLPLRDQSVDVIICSEILEHVPDLDGLLGEFYRVLRVGGRIYATMPNDLKDVLPPLRPLCRTVDRVEGHLRRMTGDEFVGVMADHGLTNLRWNYRGFIFSGVWYRLFIYNPRVKERAVAAIQGETSRRSQVLETVAFSAMRAYLAGDRLFRRWRRCMGIDAAFVKAH